MVSVSDLSGACRILEKVVEDIKSNSIEQLYVVYLESLWNILDRDIWEEEFDFLILTE